MDIYYPIYYLCITTTVYAEETGMSVQNAATILKPNKTPNEKYLILSNHFFCLTSEFIILKKILRDTF